MATKMDIVVDFDGVIHSYTSSWVSADYMPDPPVPGAIAFLREAVQHFRVNIHSSRSHAEGGIGAMKAYLRQWELEDDKWVDQLHFPLHKPPAFLTIDDRAWVFMGTFPTMDEIRSFKPWNRK